MKAREARFSKNVEKASDAVHAARDDLKRALQRAYPLGEFVRVIHHRGEYTGVVIGHNEHGARVVIENDESGKVSRRYFRDVEMETDS
jgi:hypothetical protein